MPDPLESDYRATAPLAEMFLAEFMHQFRALISRADIKLGVPLEGRVKEWNSFLAKLDRKALAVDNCKGVSDLIGVRAIALFTRDVKAICKLIERTFPINEMEDKGLSLKNSKFGYLSRHFVVGLPKPWRRIPTFSHHDFLVEVQVRTLSQHIWAAASHHLQYKKEADVPAKVSRSIHRVAALLETVDLEFERVLDERSRYAKSTQAVEASTPLDADNLKLLLERSFPPENRADEEDYSEVLTDLREFGITTVESLRALVSKRLQDVLEADKALVEKFHNTFGEAAGERTKRGVFLTHSGLARRLLVLEFGARWRQYRREHRPFALRKASESAAQPESNDKQVKG